MKKSILAVLLLMFSFGAIAASVEFSYTPPSEYVDNEPLSISDVQTFKVYDNGVEVKDFASYPLPNNAVGFTIDNLSFGEHNYNLTTVMKNGDESAYSETVTFRIHTNPKPPSGVTANIIQ